MIIFAGLKVVYMISERINEQMANRGVNQTQLCNELSLTISNFNAFIKGKRPMPFRDLVAVMKFLRLSVGPVGAEYSSVEPENIKEAFRARIKQGGFKMAEVEAASGINRSTITSIVNGKRVTSTRNIGRLMDALGLDVVRYRSEQANG